MKKLVLFIVVLSAFGVSAQQTPLFNQYFVNPYFLNPAWAGGDQTRIFLDFRKQWSGITGAPESQLLTIDGPLANKKIGFGFTAYNDVNNIFRRVSGMATFSYQFNITKNQYVRMGASAGLTQNNLLFENIYAEDPTEAALLPSSQNASSFDASFGLAYVLGDFKLGLVGQQLLGSSFTYEDNFAEKELFYSLINHFTGTLSYDFLVNKKWTITPLVLYRTPQGIRGQFDGNLKVAYNDAAWINLAYRHQVGYAASVGGIIDRKIIVGYTYEMPSTQLMNYSTGTHEIVLGIKLGSGASSDNASDAELRKIKERQNELLERTDYIEEHNKQQDKQIEKNQKEIKEIIDGLEEWKKIQEAQAEELKKFIQENSFNPNENNGSGESENGGSNKNGNEPSSSSNGNSGNQNSSDLEGNSNTSSAIDSLDVMDTEDNSYYIVVGACRKLENAKKFQKMVMREYELETRVLRNKRDTWYLIYTEQVFSKEEANFVLKIARQQDKKGLYVGKPWIYKTAKR